MMNAQEDDDVNTQTVDLLTRDAISAVAAVRAHARDVVAEHRAQIDRMKYDYGLQVSAHALREGELSLIIMRQQKELEGLRKEIERYTQPTLAFT